MLRKIRKGVFETNSSSTHSLCICGKDDYEAWERGDILFDSYKGEFKSVRLTEEQKKDAEEKYNKTKKGFWKEWKELDDKSKDVFYTKYAKDEDIVDEDFETYEEYWNEDCLETFEEEYTTKNGDKVVAFGKYGYN